MVPNDVRVQIVKSHGVPEENIVTMMFDDIANNTKNPDQGVIINQPNGPNVYEGVVKVRQDQNGSGQVTKHSIHVKDYTGLDVTPKNFLRILAGKQMSVGSGKVIRSGPKDRIFVYFADHGAPGLIAFPNNHKASKPPYLYADELERTLKKMHRAKKYNKLVFYLEACESGSMFEKWLTSNTGIDMYATTAANSETSSYACYLDNRLGTYLGDVYSVKWMQDSDMENLAKEPLIEQFDIVYDETTTSEVCEFGDLTVADLPVGAFQGDKRKKDSIWGFDQMAGDACEDDSVPSWEGKIVRAFDMTHTFAF